MKSNNLGRFYFELESGRGEHQLESPHKHICFAQKELERPACKERKNKVDRPPPPNEIFIGVRVR